MASPASGVRCCHCHGERGTEDSSLDIRPTDGAAINREFDGIRRRFPARQAYITVDRNGRVAATVHHDVEPATPGRIKTVQGVVWDPASGRRVSVSTPYWVFQATRWKAKALGTVVRRFDQQLGLESQVRTRVA